MSRGLGEFQRAILQHKFQGRSTVRAIARYMTENRRNPTKTEIGQVRRACRALVAAGYFESIATVEGEAFQRTRKASKEFPLRRELQIGWRNTGELFRKGAR